MKGNNDTFWLMPSGDNYDIDKMIEKSKRKELVKLMFLSNSALEKISKDNQKTD